MVSVPRMCAVCGAWCAVWCGLPARLRLRHGGSPAQAASSGSYLHINCWSPHCRGTLGTLALVQCIYTCTGPTYIHLTPATAQLFTHTQTKRREPRHGVQRAGRIADKKCGWWRRRSHIASSAGSRDHVTVPSALCTADTVETVDTVDTV